MKDGTYNITGTKIFITGGDHDLSENIIHLVLANTRCTARFTRYFTVYRAEFIVNADGSLGERNE